MRFTGCDIAPNHSAFVSVDEGGELTDFRFFTQKKDIAEAGGDRAVRSTTWTKKQVPDPAARRMLRLAEDFGLFRRFLRELAPSFAYIEDYAMGAHGGEAIAEVGGLARLSLWAAGVPFRIMDVHSLKMFATFNGNAEKIDVVNAVRSRWGQDFSAFAGDTEEDLSDAFTLARMAWTEWKIRQGKMLLADLEHEKERQVFLRTSKNQPTNILGVEWTSIEAVPEKFR